MKMTSRLIGLISKKTNCTCSTLLLLVSKKQSCACSTLFCLSLAVVLHDDNENDFKTNRSNQQKNKLHVQHTSSTSQQKTNLHVQHAFLSFPCRCFARLQRKELSYVLTQYFVSCVHVCFYFSLPLIFTLLTASISHFLTPALNFSIHVFLPTKFLFFVFNNSLQLFLCYPRQCKHKK